MVEIGPTSRPATPPPEPGCSRFRSGRRWQGGSS